MYFKERRAYLLLEHGVVRSAFLQRVRGQCECLEASCWWSHGDTRAFPLCVIVGQVVRVKVSREYLLRLS